MRSIVSTLVFLVAAVTSTATSQIIDDIPRPLPCPVPPPCRPGQPCIMRSCGITSPDVFRQSSDVRVDLADRVLRYEITETFVNRGGRVGEADFMFPLPKGAAFQDLKLSINGEMVSGETMSADRARQIYEEIVRRQRDPALLEWMGYGLLRARIFPIAPGEVKKVVVRFQTVAEREGDALRVDYFRGLRSNQY
ncbi:MAG TPA: VIT domain-containing protein, partial [Gemmatimonadaceae bacterium]|nr:VIT domain-containing protein [Gemmatimonadaceae bacterium]